MESTDNMNGGHIQIHKNCEHLKNFNSILLMGKKSLHMHLHLLVLLYSSFQSHMTHSKHCS